MSTLKVRALEGPPIVSIRSPCEVEVRLSDSALWTWIEPRA